MALRRRCIREDGMDVYVRIDQCVNPNLIFGVVVAQHARDSGLCYERCVISSTYAECSRRHLFQRADQA
jgi:hypothetical protein